MDILRLDQVVPTDPTPGLERREPSGGQRPRRRVERPDPENPEEEDDSPTEESEQHTLDTQA
jgi:hypothetical protein